MKVINYFELFGLDIRYDIDKEFLASAQRLLLRKIHPDKISASYSEAHKKMVMDLVCHINAGYKILQNDFLRANYILHIYHGPESSEVKGVHGATLMDVMNFRERFEEANASNDCGVKKSILEEVVRLRDGFLSDMIKQIEAVQSSNDEDKVELRKTLNTLDYYNALVEDFSEAPLADKI